MNRWNVFCNENAPYRIYYRQIDIDGYEMYVMFPLPMTGMECGWAVSHGATTAATIQEAVQKFYPFMVEYICDKEDSDNDTQQWWKLAGYLFLITTAIFSFGLFCFVWDWNDNGGRPANIPPDEGSYNYCGTIKYFV